MTNPHAKGRIDGLGALFSDRDALRDHQEMLFRSQLDRLRTRHPYYRESLAEIDIRSLADLHLIQPTTMQDLAADPNAFRLEPIEQSDVLWDIAYTSGSTSAPTPIFQTARDFRGILSAQLRMAAIRGMRSEDRIANLFPLTTQPHGAWTRANHAAAALGAELVVGLGGAQTEDYPVIRRTNEIIELLRRTRPTVLWGVPSYLLRVLEALNEVGVPLPTVRMLAVSGEPCSPTMAADLTRAAKVLGAPDTLVSNSFGASELQCGLVECVPGTGFHNPSPEQFYFETINDDGHPVAEGIPGKLALTHLDRRGTAFVRYLLGDVVVFSNEPCPECGWAGGRVTSHHKREGNFVKVRGNLFDVTVLLRTIADVPGVRDYQAVVRPHPGGMDELLIRVAPTGLMTVDEAALAAAVRGAVRVTPAVNIETLEAIHPTTGSLKPRRFVDERN